MRVPLKGTCRKNVRLSHVCTARLQCFDLLLQVTGSLSDGVGFLTVDQRHERVRRQIRSEAQSSGGQLMAGIKGLGHGVLGGLTSVVWQPYYGFKDDGVEVRMR